ncbi:putative transcriptional regulator [Rivularia sp. PCC 7116]|uniref:heavy metal-responsive transcriptional regulator n=1 Tax=Rivularia sp. PCC 7116 TaxID=373994 RepID=UPI00029F30CF|nr:heavy metal-responsive transcriptional regulator [Rivularia sp. PCC 7116]AFY58327.1 putative transcriptional regulator [Rivularia sp. PCC 7116]
MLANTSEPLLIGKVQKLSGVPIRTIRYYETLGIIKPLGRTESGYRKFSQDILARLSFIKRAQKLGLSLQEIGSILQVYDDGEAPCDQIHYQLENKILEIEKQIQNLQVLQNELKELLLGWKSVSNKPSNMICPNIQKN